MRRRWYGVVGVVALLATAVIGYRVLRPAETVDQAKSAFPAAAPVAEQHVYGTLLKAPIVVDGRIRVYAAPRQVYADDPVDIKSSMSPFWSYRRWPAQLLGVVAVGTTVVSQWSDGELVGLDAIRGRVAWRATLPVASGLSFTGRRTGASTVYHPRFLFTSGDTVVVLGSPDAAGYDAATGRRLWRTAMSGCRDSFTGPGVFVCSGQSIVDSRTGTPVHWDVADPAPLGCPVGNSDCAGVRGSGQAWLIAAGGALTPAPGAAAAGSWLVGTSLVVGSTSDGGVAARRPDNSPLWTWRAGPARIIAVEPGGIHLLTKDRQLVTLDPADGLELSRFPLVVESSGPFDLGEVYAAHRFLFFERLRPGATPDRDDGAYFYQSPNVVLAGS